MSSSISKSRCPRSRNFDLIKDSMLQSDEFPLAEVLDENQWQDVFEAHKINLGSDEDVVYTPAITLWALISQAFFKGEMRSCKASVGRVASLWATRGKTVCDTSTGAYCRARAKISWQAIRDICCQIVVNRLERIEPRANKRRPKMIALLTKPRHIARRELIAAA